MANNPGRYEFDNGLVHGAMGGDSMAEEYSAQHPADRYWNAYSQFRQDGREAQSGELLRRELSMAEIVRNEMANNPGRYEVDQGLVRGAMGDDAMAAGYSAVNSNDRYWNAYAQFRPERRKSQPGKSLCRELSAAEMVPNAMANNPGRCEVDEELVRSAMQGDSIAAKQPAQYPNNRYWGAQAILDRRKSQAGEFWRKTQAGELLRRELSVVEITCIIFLISATLANYL